LISRKKGGKWSGTEKREREISGGTGVTGPEKKERGTGVIGEGGLPWTGQSQSRGKT